MDGLVSFSSTPLKFVTRLGVLSAIAAVLLGIWVIGVTIREWVLKIHPTPRGWASLACLVLMMSAVQLLSLGIIGEYLARIFQEVKGRPTFLIARIEQQDRNKNNQPTGGTSADRTEQQLQQAQQAEARDRSPLA
jgi:dolichol-phosphate mannosyltransferase